MLTRRQLLKRSAAGAAVLAGPGGIVRVGPAGLLSAPAGAAPLANLRKWASACPTPTLGASAWPVIDLRSASSTTLTAEQFPVTIHPDLPPTTVWGYTGGTPGPRSTYLGPTIVARRGAPVDVTYENRLPSQPLFPEDPALIPHGLSTSRINTHLHGGRVTPAADGNPFHAYAVDPSQEVGPGVSQTKHYPNDQGGALLWYHDHALGITRTNVYAGLAGGYLLTERDARLDAAGVPTVLDASDVPHPYAAGVKIPLHIPLVIQDKTLDSRGRLVYPASWVPEFFGDNCLVNGKAFPYLDVQPRVYRFTFLNGSQSRFYNLVFSKAVPITQIGVELGLLDSPQPIRSILIGPAERADVIVDFSRLPIGTKAVLIDAALPPGVVSPTRPLGECMQFRVVGPALAGPDPFAGPPKLPGWTVKSPTPRPATPSTTSKVTLEEVMGRGGKPVMAVVNGTPFMKRDSAGMMTAEPTEPFTTEVVDAGDTVEWLYLNLTADSHPFHTHLAHFEVMGRQRFDAVAYAEALAEAREEASGALDPRDYPDVAPFVLGPEVPAPASEKGPKDTVLANPGEITRIRLVFDLPPGTRRPARYVYHCHILEHEENEMMRPLLVQ
ncbi:MAG TPA: multicopper oxidase family protein [Acidimicrobiales bacterium]|nr:multicopper oxidase family protein [Acidimicrobiales bacterium]